MHTKRCATKTDVRPDASTVRAFMMPRSVAVSSALVASSQISSRGSLRPSTLCLSHGVARSMPSTNLTLHFIGGRAYCHGTDQMIAACQRQC